MRIENTVVVLLLEVHVDDTTGPDVSHLVTIESLNFSELAGLDSVATVFSEEDGDRVVTELIGTGLVARLLVVGVTAPGVDVVTPEVDALFLFVTVEEVGHVLTDGRVVIGSIANTDLAVVLGLDVTLHITHSSLDVGAGTGGLGVV